MVLYGDVLDEVVYACRAQHNELLKLRIGRRINNDYAAIAAITSWSALRVLEADFSVSTQPVQLPADVLGIDMIWDDLNEIEYLDRRRPDAEHNEHAWRYFVYPVGSSIIEVTDATLMQDSIILVSDALSDQHAINSVIGEYFYAEGDDQLYKITAYNGGAFDISPAYRGMGESSSLTLVVRPPTTLMLQLVPPKGAEGTTSAVQLHYWKKPDVLRDARDIVRLPTSDVLALRTISKLSEAQPDRPVSQTRVEEALREAIAMNPGRPMPRVGRGIHGRKLSWNPSAVYGGRGQYVDTDIGFLRDRV